MKQKLILITISLLLLFSCQQTEKSNIMMKKAMDVYLLSDLKPEIKIDSSLALTNIALKLNKKNTQALIHKTTLLFRKKDMNGLLETVNTLIDLRPKKPFYLGQKAFYLELKGDSIESNRYYKKALEKYKNYLESDSLNFDLKLEYIGVLEAYGDTTLANRNLKEMKNMNYKKIQKEMLEMYKSQTISKEKLKKYWNGEIEYEQIAE